MKKDGGRWTIIDCWGEYVKEGSELLKAVADALKADKGK